MPVFCKLWINDESFFLYSYDCFFISRLISVVKLVFILFIMLFCHRVYWFIVWIFSIISIRISRKENCLHETGQVLVTRGKYDEIDIDMEVTFTSTLNRNEGKEIMSVKQYDGGCDVDESPYAECPENVYDKMFTARPHVNKVPENVYQSVEVGNSKYSMVKLISNHTSWIVIELLVTPNLTK